MNGLSLPWLGYLKLSGDSKASADFPEQFVGGKWPYLNVSPSPPCTSGPKEMSTVVNGLFVALFFFFHNFGSFYFYWGAGEDSWESLELQGDQPVNPKGNQTWIFIGRTDAETEAPILWPPNVKSCSLEKTLMLGKMQEEKGATEDEMIGWHQRLNEHESEETLRDSEGQGSLQGTLTQSVWFLVSFIAVPIFGLCIVPFVFNCTQVIQIRCVCVCVCVWERERERERSPMCLKQEEAYSVKSATSLWEDFMAIFYFLFL